MQAVAIAMHPDTHRVNQYRTPESVDTPTTTTTMMYSSKLKIYSTMLLLSWHLEWLLLTLLLLLLLQ